MNFIVKNMLSKAYPSLWQRQLVHKVKVGCLILPVSALLSFSTLSYSEATKLSLNVENKSVQDVLSIIEKESSFYFTYNLAQVDASRKVSLKIDDQNIDAILDDLFTSEGVKYTINDKHVVLYKDEAKEVKSQQAVKASEATRKITGIVTDEKGEPIIGANVVEKGTTNGTITDFDGNFTMKVGNNAELQVSYIGYIPKTVKVGKNNSLSIALSEDTKNLDEVIVIGYGTQKKSNVSGSVTSVSGDKLANLPTAGAAEALQGMAPGLSVNFGDGSPGAKPSMMVRGMTSWGSSNDPLVIIDGTPGDISFLNPEDIKSMTVLKDAATAAIYGARAAAGVILIETHRGSKQAPKINVSAYMGMDDLPKRMEVCNSEEYIFVNKLALTNAGIPESKWPKYIKAYEDDPTRFADTDWQKEYYRRGFTQKYNLGYTAGNDIMNVAFSGYYSSTEGIVVGTNSSKLGFRLNSDVKIGKFKVGESVSYGQSNIKPEANTGFPGMYQTTNIQPLIHVYDENNEGGYGGAIPGLGMTDAANPVAFNNLIDQKNITDYFTASGYVLYEPIKNLFFKFQGSCNMNFDHNKSFTPTYYVGANSVNTLASLYESRSKAMETLLELTGNYDVTIKDKHSIAAMLGLSQEERSYSDLMGSASRFENNDMTYLVHGQDNFAVGGGYNRNALRSAFGRLSYNYDYRYLLMVSARYDGSSRFANGKKWGFFPSASLGWNVANESFWENMKETVSTLKLRLSYGGLGNQAIGNYKYIPRLTYNDNALNYPFAGNGINLGYAITGLPSYNIKWETTMYQNIGLDVGLWNNKLELSVEGYIKDTKDMLSSKNISLCTGFGSLIVNEGKLRTTGIEMQAIYHGKIGNFQYDLDMNISHYKSVLKQMSDPGYMDEVGPARTYVGGEIGEFWVLKTAGLFQSQAEVDEWNSKYGFYDQKNNWNPLQPAAKPGDVRFIDQNGDGKLDSNDKVKVGSGNPKVVLGFNINMRYKAFDLVANFYGNFGAKRYNYMKRQLIRMDKNFNYGKDALNSWREDNTNTDVPRAVIGDPNGNNKTSDRFVENGSYLRLNNLQLGYTLPGYICQKLKIDNLRVYVGANRLFTITSYKGYDPGMGSTGGGSYMGVDDALYPLSRTYMIGLKFGF